MFHALAHPARRAIIRQLSGGERNLSELAAPLKMTFPAATKHARVLEHAKLVRRRVARAAAFRRLEAAPLKQATLWTESFRQHWEARFEALDALLDEIESEGAIACSSPLSVLPPLSPFQPVSFVSQSRCGSPPTGSQPPGRQRPIGRSKPSG